GHAVVGPELVLEVEGAVPAGLVVVAEHVVRAGDHAAGAAGAEAGGDDLVEQLLPLHRPPLALGGRGVFDYGHAAEVIGRVSGPARPGRRRRAHRRRAARSAACTAPT